MEAVIERSSSVTQNVADYVNRLGISLSQMSRETGLGYGILRASLAERPTRNRSLRDDEFILICKYLEKDPLDFFTE